MLYITEWNFGVSRVQIVKEEDFSFQGEITENSPGNPFGDAAFVTHDGTYLYVSDDFDVPRRVTKYSLSNPISPVYLNSIAPTFPPIHDFVSPCIKANSSFLYVGEVNGSRFRKYTLGLVFVDEYDGVPFILEEPRVVLPDASNTYLYLLDNFSTKIWRLSASTYVEDLSSDGSDSGAAFADIRDVCFDSTGTYLYVADTGNNRIVKLLVSDLSYVSQIGTLGSGNDEFDYPIGIHSRENNLWICDLNNNRIVRRNATDLSFISKYTSVNYPFTVLSLPESTLAAPALISVTPGPKNNTLTWTWSA